MLPYFFRHYDSLVDRYFICDNRSTDRSRDLLAANRKVVLAEFRIDGDSFVQAATNHYNQCWKQSRGAADWVIVVNVDEHVYHPDLRGYLQACTRNGVSILLPEGYNMVADGWPSSRKPLWKTVQYGMRDPIWDKPQVFDPNRIREINFSEGPAFRVTDRRGRVPEKGAGSAAALQVPRRRIPRAQACGTESPHPGRRPGEGLGIPVSLGRSAEHRRASASQGGRCSCSVASDAGVDRWRPSTAFASFA